MMRLGKTRTKNIIQFWQKQPDAYHELCRAGAFFPIQGIRAGSFSFFINEPVPAEWQCKRTFDRFHFHFHHHSNVWIIDGNALYALRLADFPDNGNDEYRITTLNGQTIKTAQKIPPPQASGNCISACCTSRQTATHSGSAFVSPATHAAAQSTTRARNLILMRTVRQPENPFSHFGFATSLRHAGCLSKA